MVIYCKACRGRLRRAGGEWKHENGGPFDSHVALPLAARRCRLFDPGVVGLPGYDRALVWLVKGEKTAKSPVEAWRIGLYVFDGRIRGVFRYNGDASKNRPGALFQAPEKPSDAFLRNHPIVKERLAALAATRKKAAPASRAEGSPS